MIAFPNCKINLGLNIVRKRADGFHDILTAFHPVGLSDILEIIPAADNKFEFSTGGNPVDCQTEGNLVVKAYRLMKERFNIPPVKIYLHKLIPSGAGLGGGSSDAAFTIRMINEMFHTGLSQDVMMSLAGTLGSDCPFFIRNIPVIARGRGDVFNESLLNLKGLNVVIIHPGIKISTADAYSHSIPSGEEGTLGKIIMEDPCYWKYQLVNDFEQFAFSHFPVLREIKERLYSSGAFYASMTGSGSAVYGLYKTIPFFGESLPKNYFIWTGIMA